MIPPLAAALYGFSVLCLVMALLVALGYRATQPPSPYRSFGLYLTAMALQAFGTAWLTHAPDLAEGMRAQSAQLVGQSLALAAYMDFQQCATRNEPRLLVLALRGLVGVLVLLAATGLMVVPGVPLPKARWALPFAIDYPQARLSEIGVVAYVVAMTLVSYGVFKLFRSAWLRERGAAPISGALLAAFAVALACVIHDQLMRLGVIRSVFLLEPAVLLCTLTASTDIARRFAREGDELRTRNDELEATVWQLSEARDKLVHTRRLAAIGELSAVIAHEVRNPLAVIKNAAAGLRRRESLQEATRVELVNIIREENGRLTRLVSDMLTYAKPLQLKHARHHPRELIAAAIERAYAEVGVPECTPVELAEELDALPPVEGDGRLLVVALGNVVSNALHATAPGGRVDVAGRTHTGAGSAATFVEWIIRDHGPGMDADTRAKAIEPFFTTRPKGTGLGLAIADRVADAHGGALVLDSELGHGTRVTLRVPVQPA